MIRNTFLVKRGLIIYPAKKKKKCVCWELRRLFTKDFHRTKGYECERLMERRRVDKETERDHGRGLGLRVVSLLCIHV